MKFMLKQFSRNLVIASICGVAGLLLSASTASAQFGFQTGFEPPEYAPPGGLSDFNLWDTTDVTTHVQDTTTFENIGQADSVGPIDGSFTGFYQASLGGRGVAVPGTQTVELFRPFDVTSYPTFQFDTDFKIFSSTDTLYNAATDRDTFGWSLYSGNTIKLAVTFTPAAGNFFDVRIDGGTSLVQLNYNAVHHIGVGIMANGDVHVTFNGTEWYYAASSINPTAITSVRAVQTVTSNFTDGQGAYTQAGNNQLVFDNYSAVPEPSTIGLSIIAGLGGLGLMMRRRKAA